MLFIDPFYLTYVVVYRLSVCYLSFLTDNEPIIDSKHSAHFGVKFSFVPISACP